MPVSGYSQPPVVAVAEEEIPVEMSAEELNELVLGEQKDWKKVEVKRFSELAGKYGKLAFFGTIFFFMIGVLGLALATINRSKSERAGKMITAFGFIISVFTFTNNVIFPEDYRVYNKASSEYENGIDELTKTKTFSSFGEYQIWSEDVEALIKRLEDMEKPEVSAMFKELFESDQKDMEKPEVSAMFKGFFASVSMAYAEEAFPSWINKKPKSKTYFVFVGTGNDNNLLKARTLSEANARAQARKFLKQLLGELSNDSQWVDGLLGKMEKKGKVKSKFYQWDKPQMKYQYYTKIIIHKGTAAKQAYFHSIRTKTGNARQIKKAINKKMQ
jgi:hypothetical protein